MVATALLLAMGSRLRPDWNTALIGSPDVTSPAPVVSSAPTPSFDDISNEGDAMSRPRPSHPVPRGGIDPIRSAADALAVLALGAPYGHDTIMIPLDTERRGSSVIVVNDTVEADALFQVIDVCIAVSRRIPDLDALILASSRPEGGARPDDVHRWLEASDQCHAGGLVLVEWFVLGRSGPQCPRELFGSPARWVA
jgi:hypothetical protein